MNAHDAFHETVHGAPGGCEVLAMRLDMSTAVLRNKANPNAAGNIVGLRDVERVMGLTGDHRVLHALAKDFGYVCVKVGEGATASDLAVLEIVTSVWVANGNLGGAVNDALADGRIEQREVDRIKAMVFKADRSMHELVARMQGMVDK